MREAREFAAGNDPLCGELAARCRVEGGSCGKPDIAGKSVGTLQIANGTRTTHTRAAYKDVVGHRDAPRQGQAASGGNGNGFATRTGIICQDKGSPCRHSGTAGVSVGTAQDLRAIARNMD